MINIKRYSSEDAVTWNIFNHSAKNSLFMFDRNYMDYHSNRFKDHSLLFYFFDDLVAILPASEKDSSLISHGGLTYGGFIVGNTMKQHLMMDCMQNLREYMNIAKINTIVYKTIPFIYWNQPAEEDQYGLYRIGAHLRKIEASTVINLHDPLDMAKLRKRMIKKATKGLNEEMIAGTLLFEYDNVVHTQYLAANDEARRIGALDLVISEVIERYRSSKAWLDFGISTENDGMILNEGLISQKEGFGGRTIIYKTWEINA